MRRLATLALGAVLSTSALITYAAPATALPLLPGPTAPCKPAPCVDYAAVSGTLSGATMGITGTGGSLGPLCGATSSTWSFVATGGTLTETTANLTGRMTLSSGACSYAGNVNIMGNPNTKLTYAPTSQYNGDMISGATSSRPDGSGGWLLNGELRLMQPNA